MRGTIKRIDEHRGYGFIRPEGGERPDDVFFHATQAPDFTTLAVNMSVEFETENTDRGVRAKNVRLLEA
ncbi:MAG: cold shock domain-containing protein [Pirellulales bacterium]|nr:cold shock domain-containing protein [Pirellulales bacterium]